ncbi:hypothetical protein [Chitinophaga cymbidii]|uniref:Uncharacterized protein n=1 Tax=Chitinophaga cymbidii TaxID=1096750 RepID=A0A512RFP9_9BACT|nr:hypothetical protein [Chitinophaga cymbidii]GEP94521.1 hypothetical protein CCY01nite_07810 [Chitinophaga cymbidii]
MKAEPYKRQTGPPKFQMMKSHLLQIALALGIGMAFSFGEQAADCFSVGSIGYTSPYTPDGTAPDPSSPFRIPGAYAFDYSCIVDDRFHCRYIYDATYGIWISCVGEYKIIEDLDDRSVKASIRPD